MSSALALFEQKHACDGNGQRVFPVWGDSRGQVLTGQMLMRSANPYHCACIPKHTHAKIGRTS